MFVFNNTRLEHKVTVIKFYHGGEYPNDFTFVFKVTNCTHKGDAR